MRTTQERRITVCFEDDCEDGGTLLTCGKCGTEFKHYNNHGDVEYCKVCGIELLYPGWASW